MFFEAVVLLYAEAATTSWCEMGAILPMLQTVDDIPGIKRKSRAVRPAFKPINERRWTMTRNTSLQSFKAFAS